LRLRNHARRSTPAARLGVTRRFSERCAGDTMFLFGGHTLVVDPADKSESDVVHDDVWALDLNTHQVRDPSTNM
jgi:hypothetical protein